MTELLQEQPSTTTALREWASRAIAELTDKAEGDMRGPLNTELQARAAELIRLAKLFAFRLGLVQLCNRLPARDYKTAIDAILRLTEVVEWREPAPVPQDGRALTVAQAADVLGVTGKTVYGLIESEQLGHHRVGNRIRIRPSDLEAYQRRSERTGFRHLFR
jgi:excisionase family DNA binding protein